MGQVSFGGRQMDRRGLISRPVECIQLRSSDRADTARWGVERAAGLVLVKGLLNGKSEHEAQAAHTSHSGASTTPAQSCSDCLFIGCLQTRNSLYSKSRFEQHMHARVAREVLHLDQRLFFIIT